MYDGDHIKAHSALIRNILAPIEPHPIIRVYLRGATIETLRIVLNEIDKVQPGEVLQMKIRTRDLSKAINIHRAIHYLQVEPAQPLVEGHFHGRLSKQLVNPDEVVAIFLNYGNPDGRFYRIFQIMVQKIAWDFVHDKIPPRQAELLKAAAERYPDIDAAIKAQVIQERGDKQRRDERDERKAAKKQERQERKAGRNLGGNWRK